MNRLLGLTAEEQVEELAALSFSVTEIAVFTGLDCDTLRNEIAQGENTPLAKAYQKGKLRTKIMLRYDSLQFALHGSPDALREMREYMSKQAIDEQDA